jgi:hypothetical protein
MIMAARRATVPITILTICKGIQRNYRGCIRWQGNVLAKPYLFI